MDDMKKPLGLYLEPHGFWKIDKVIRGERIRLCTQTSNLAEAKEILGRYVRGHSRRHLQTAWETTVEGMLRDRKSWLHRTAQGMAYRGRRSGRGASMTPSQVAEILLRCNGYCEVTGIALSFDRPDPSKRAAPFQPSIDRIDSSKGYDAANCRVVALAVNLAMREWGEAVIARIGKAIFLKGLEKEVRGESGADLPKIYPGIPLVEKVNPVTR